LLQAMKRTADRRPAQTHPRDHRAFRHAGSRRQLARDDQLAELMIDA